MDKRKFASYGCFGVFSVLAIFILALSPYIELAILEFCKDYEAEKIATSTLILLAVLYMMASAVLLYGIPTVLTLIQFYLRRELFKIQLFWLCLSFIIPNIFVIAVILLKI